MRKRETTGFLFIIHIQQFDGNPLQNYEFECGMVNYKTEEVLHSLPCIPYVL